MADFILTLGLTVSVFGLSAYMESKRYIRLWERDVNDVSDDETHKRF